MEAALILVCSTCNSGKRGEQRRTANRGQFSAGRKFRRLFAIGILTGNRIALVILGVLLALWGVYSLWLIVRNPDELTATENHPSWRHMYLMMMAAQIGFAVAYLV